MLYEDFKTVETHSLIIGYTSPNGQVLELINHLSVETQAAVTWSVQASSGILAFLALATLIGVFLRKL